MIKPILTLLLMALATGFIQRPEAWSQEINSYTHDEWTTDDGLPQNTILSVIQSHSGYIWLGTYEGLVRYNGTSFTVFDSRNTPALTNHAIISLLETTDSTIWIGTRSGLFSLKNQEIGLPDFSQRTQGRFIRSLAMGQDNELWVGTDNGLLQIRNGNVKEYRLSDGLISETITALTTGPDGSVWIGTPLGLIRLSDGQFFTYGLREGLPSLYIRSLVTDQNQTVWVGTSNGLARIIDREIEKAPPGLAPENPVITSLMSDREGGLWIGTDEGVYRFNAGLQSSFTTADGLSSNRVRSLFQDREGTMWVGTNVGLNTLRRGRFTVLTSAKGLSDDYTRTVYEAPDGWVWIGTSSGLNAWNPADNKIRQQFQGLPVTEVLSVASDEQGQLWVGTAGKGLYKGRAGVFSPVVYSSDQNGSVIRALLPSSNGGMWIGSTRGLYHYRNGQVSLFTNRNGTSNNFILSLAYEASGALLVGTSNGLNRLNPDGQIDMIRLPGGGLMSNVFSIYPEADSLVWIGTDAGLYLLKAEKVFRITTREGLFDDVAFQILDDAQGNLWMTCNKGIYSVSRQQLLDLVDGRRKSVESQAYGKTDGLKTSQCNGSSQPAGWRTRDGRLLFPTARGMAILNPAEKPTINTTPPPVVLESILSYNLPMAVSQRVELSPGIKRFEFQFAVLSFIEPEKVQCRYRLFGYDDDWIDARNLRQATYTNLPPGRYRFQVIAANNDGYWNDDGASVDLYVEPLFYQTSWFWIILVGFFGLLLTGGHFYRISSLKNSERRLAVLVNERTRDIVAEKQRSDEARESLREKSDALQVALTRLQQTQFQLIQNEKMASLGQLTAGLAHELNNPMNYILSALVPLKRDFDLLTSLVNDARQLPIPGLADALHLHDYDEILKEIPVLLSGIQDGAKRTEAIVSGFRRFARPEEDTPKKTSIADCFETTLSVIGGRLSPSVLIVKDFKPVPLVDCFPGQINQVIFNLISNAEDAMPHGGLLTLSISPKDENTVQFSVADTGEGIPEESVKKIFEPFYSTRQVGKGSGLGLFVVYGIVNAHHGTISVESSPGEGSCFSVTLPVRMQ
ncbi:MAG: hypothetical protein HUU10_06100 [Bacteroidetes bacterium]|nr:hypothetical protein [Bacteroidota bacterium]